MTTQQLVRKLEAAHYLFVVVEEDSGTQARLTAVDPCGYKVEVIKKGDTVIDRRLDQTMYDIMYIGEASYL